MRCAVITILVAFLAGPVLAGPVLASPADGRFPQAYSEPMSGDTDPYANVIASDDGTFEYWGAAASWADEEQVGFVMPDGGPWLVWRVQVWMSGTSVHRVVLREACDTIWNQPCDVLDQSITFAPGYPAPPDSWVTVELLPLGLMLGGGEEIFVGVTLDGADDGIGLDTTAPDGHTWGLYGGAWEDDCYLWGAQAAIRLIVTDTSFDAEEVTWGAIKALFRPPASFMVLSPARHPQGR